MFSFSLVHLVEENSQEIYQLDSNIASQNLFDIDSSSIDAEFSHGKNRLNIIINLKSIFVYIFILAVKQIGNDATLQQLVNCTNLYFTRMDKKLDVIISYLKNNSSGVKAPMLDTQFLNLFPMNNESELYDVEEKIKIEEYNDKFVSSGNLF